MSETSAQNVLRRKATAAREANEAKVTPEKSLSGAMARAAEKAFEMPLVATNCSLADASLAELLERMPEKGLVAVLEGPGETLGIITLDANFLSALVEQQTIGHVAPYVPDERRATRTDANLCADWIDRMLRLFEDPLRPTSASTWTYGYSFSNAMADIRPLGLMLEEDTYRVFNVGVKLGEVAREGQAMLALLANGKGPLPGGKPQATDDSAEGQRRIWQEQLTEAVEGGAVTLTGVLHRVPMSIAEASGLQVGDLIPIPTTALGAVEIVSADDTVLSHGRLGQSLSHRALRLIDPAEAAMAEPQMEALTDLSAPPMPGPLDLQTEPPNIEMPDLPDLPDIADLPDLPPGGDLPEIDTGADLPDLPDLGALPDLGDDNGPAMAFDDLPNIS
ncbi:MAG: FliM/FliN family flagellar motor switch protein [Pseudomonadota bacterium]